MEESMPKNKAEEFRRNAQEARTQARAANDSEVRRQLEEIAMQWDKLAEHQEQTCPKK